MAHKRLNFTEKQKAIIFKRDRATCAFSGISLWLLDSGISPNWRMDWADHIRPNAAGGTAQLENGICASCTFNAKKKDNSYDTLYFVKNGLITDDYISIFGIPSQMFLNQLDRLGRLEIIDWYFNRCLANTFIGFDWRCVSEFEQVRKKRDDHYWFGSGWKRMKRFIKQRPELTYLERNLM
ncbi:MAG: HNH endonuclease [Endozoicomonas sp.]|uniref:HNH endonuclease n=1 Tax=Endozoicomonas sp. TaxID=1892382 RepID=UPI003D9B72A1